MSIFDLYSVYMTVRLYRQVIKDAMKGAVIALPAILGVKLAGRRCTLRVDVILED